MIELKVKCIKCREENYHAVYLFNEQIATRGIPFSDHKDYIAFVEGKSICPRCGEMNRTLFENEIPRSDIKNLATKRHQK